MNLRPAANFPAGFGGGRRGRSGRLAGHALRPQPFEIGLGRRFPRAIGSEAFGRIDEPALRRHLLDEGGVVPIRPAVAKFLRAVQQALLAAFDIFRAGAAIGHGVELGRSQRAGAAALRGVSGGVRAKGATPGNNHLDRPLQTGRIRPGMQIGGDIVMAGLAEQPVPLDAGRHFHGRPPRIADQTGNDVFRIFRGIGTAIHRVRSC